MAACSICGTRLVWGGMGSMPHAPRLCADRLLWARAELLDVLDARAAAEGHREVVAGVFGGGGG